MAKNTNQFQKEYNQTSSQNFQNYLQNKEENLRKKLYKESKVQNKRAWVLVVVLGVCLIGLGSYTLSTINNTQDISSSDTGSVAGVISNNQSAGQIVTGYGFSIVPDSAVPSEFVRSRESVDFEPITDRTALQTSFLVSNTDDNNLKQTGIQVQAIEYDNQFNKEGFTNQILDFLGEDFSLESSDINIPKEVKLSKISAKDESGISYYTTVTNDYYYLIKAYDQNQGVVGFEQVNSFNENILSWIYLN